MPSVDDTNIVPGTGTTYYPPSNSTTTATPVSATAPLNTDYVVSKNNSYAFVHLTDGPGGIVENSVLLGGDGVLAWSAVPTQANQAFVWDGSEFIWETLAEFTGVLFVSIPFTETTSTIQVGSFNNQTLIKAKAVIKTPFNANTTIDVGTSQSVGSVMPDSDITQNQVGIYVDELYIPYSQATVVNLAINAAGTGGTGTLILEYIPGTN